MLSLMGLLLLSGCGGAAFAGFAIQTTDVTEPTVQQEVRAFEQGMVGPQYVFAVEVPEAWVDNFRLTNNGSTVTFNFVTDRGRTAPIFRIEALTRGQYWEQQGSYPSAFNNIVSQDDTYFIYYAPLDEYYSGLPEAEFLALRDEIPGIIATFRAERIENGTGMMSAGS
jgi:hypothetical protein